MTGCGAAAPAKRKKILGRCNTSLKLEKPANMKADPFKLLKHNLKSKSSNTEGFQNSPT